MKRKAEEEEITNNKKLIKYTRKITPISNDILMNIANYLNSKELLNFIKTNKFIYENNNILYFQLLKNNYVNEKRKHKFDNNNIKDWKEYYYNFHLNKNIIPKYYLKDIPIYKYFKNYSFDIKFLNEESYEILLYYYKLNKIILINNEKKILLNYKIEENIHFSYILFDKNDNFLLISRRSGLLEKRNYIFNRKELKLEYKFNLPDAIEDVIYNEKDDVNFFF
jgi:hypothetical protein